MHTAIPSSRRLVTLLGTTLCAGAALVAVPAAADAAVLTSADTTVKCGHSIEVGVWNCPGDPAPASRRVKIQLRSAQGYTLRSVTRTARSSGRYRHFSARCGRTYRVTFTSRAFGSYTQKVRVRG